MRWPPPLFAHAALRHEQAILRLAQKVSFRQDYFPLFFGFFQTGGLFRPHKVILSALEKIFL